MFEVLKKIIVTVAIVGGLATPMIHASIIPGNEIPFQQQVRFHCLASLLHFY